MCNCFERILFMQQRSWTCGDLFSLSEMLCAWCAGAVWEQQAAALPPLVTAQRSLPQSGTCTPGSCTPRTPALPPQHPYR